MNRRGFLKSLASGAPVIALPSAALAAKSSPAVALPAITAPVPRHGAPLSSAYFIEQAAQQSAILEALRKAGIVK